MTLRSNTTLHVKQCDIGLDFAVSIISRSAVTYYCAKKENPLNYTACKLNAVEWSDDISNKEYINNTKNILI